MAALNFLNLENDSDESHDKKLNTEEILARELLRTPDNSNTIFRPSLSDENAAGFFRVTHSTQTDVSEIVQLKELTETVERMLEVSSEMKRGIAFIQCSMSADFEKKLQQKAIDLYLRVNDKVAALEKQHVERVDTIRRAFRQQLSDAITQIHAFYTSDADKQLASHKSQSTTTAKRLRELESLVRAKDVEIQELSDKVVILENSRSTRSPDESSVNDAQRYSHSPSDELSVAQEELTQLELKIAKLEDDGVLKDNAISDLQKKLEHSLLEIDRTKREVDMLKKSKEALIAAMENHHNTNTKALENQKQAMEREREEAIRRAREDLQVEANRRQPEPPVRHITEVQSNGVDRQQYSRLMQEKKALEDELAKTKAEVEVKNRKIKDLESSHDNQAYLKDQVNRLKSELATLEKNWQKKFSILQKSMFALKDESYLRQTLQRQAAALHQAAVSYAYDGPTGDFHSTVKSKKVLPGIMHPRSAPKDFISYTVTPPPNEKTFVSFECNENQILSDDEEFPEDIIPLPSGTPVH